MYRGGRQADTEVARQADRLTDRWMDRMDGQTDI